MPDAPPNPELLRSLGRLVRGLSALFWGLPTSLILCLGTATGTWFRGYGVVPPMAATGLLLFGLWQLGAFQKQERPWRAALDSARFLALVNLGLSPFLFWWNRMPQDRYFDLLLHVLAFSTLAFLFSLNWVVLRLGAMLPDETLRLETRQYTMVNFVILAAAFLFAAALVSTAELLPATDWLKAYVRLLQRNEFWLTLILLVMPLALFILLPLAMTMALIWKTKEVILDSVFGGHRS
jgi:hypothetical protein